MKCLERLGMKARSLSQWRDSGFAEDNSVVLTFDDGYKDMLTTVAPELESRGWSATVFLACRLTDQEKAPFAPWARLLSWSEADELRRAGWEIGSHTLTHPDLCLLGAEELEREVADSRSEIEQRLGCPVVSFAAPFGAVNQQVVDCIGKHYEVAVSTRLEVAGKESDRLNLPRLEIYYFELLKRFEQLMRGRAGTYISVRRTMRRVKERLEGKP